MDSNINIGNFRSKKFCVIFFNKSSFFQNILYVNLSSTIPITSFIMFNKPTSDCCSFYKDRPYYFPINYPLNSNIISAKIKKEHIFFLQSTRNFVNWNCLIVQKQRLYNFNAEVLTAYFKTEKNSVGCHYHCCVSICHSHDHVIGHFFYEFYSLYVFFPTIIKKKSITILPKKTHFVVDYIEVASINHFQIKVLPKNIFYFCDFVYTVYPNPYGKYFAKLIIKLKEFLNNFLKKSSVPGFSCNNVLFYNKPKNSRRHIANFEEIIYFFGRKTDKFNFYVCPELVSIHQSFHLFGETFCFVAVHSSIFINTLYLKNHSIVIEISTKSISPNWYLVTSYLHIFHVIYHVPFISDFGVGNYLLSIKKLFNLFVFSLDKYQQNSLDKETVNHQTFNF
ncbi:hypothetical protein TRFO_40242 [Tritrichomonas foetus]|uniref:Glycosyltransferase 61 catalytic domain-containing protein n=1 Tax=Tritrichomonas foetus TaxID=1144522 RepID=A0A1J4J1T1_9EUKA|nr:hypothetical protein TRFO_40242 [Tritrichomonas foetus]|eukprot:OHS93470.1 hypothetical protein TRFO_40242 [Tritrichomonas foetus]